MLCASIQQYRTGPQKKWNENYKTHWKLSAVKKFQCQKKANVNQE